MVLFLAAAGFVAQYLFQRASSKSSKSSSHGKKVEWETTTYKQAAKAKKLR
jgi:hypothetical protein